MKTCIINGKVIFKDRIECLNVYYENDLITEISSRKPNDENIIDAKGDYVSPGFVDLHIHGKRGSDTMYATFDHINNISKAQAISGCTSFLPTTMTMSIEDTNKAIDEVVKAKDKVQASKIIGIHLEGPFFSKTYKGAQPEEYMIAPTVDNYLKLVKDHGGFIKKISLAPELENTKPLIEYLVSKGISVSIGHSDATCNQALQAFDLGVNSTTHTYNAMTPLTHREPGIVGAAMVDDRVYCELILDGIHVSYPAVKVLMKTKGYDKVLFVSDSIEAAQLPDGQYQLGGQPVCVKEGIARLENGALAGSVLNMNKAVKIAYQDLNIPLYEAVKMASLVPANSIHCYDIGEIAVHKKADILLFNEDIEINNIIVNGEKLKDADLKK